MNNNEKICLTLILVKVFDIYFHHYFATNKKIAITHLWHAIEPQTKCHLIVKDKVADRVGVKYIEMYLSTSTTTLLILKYKYKYKSFFHQST